MTNRIRELEMLTPLLLHTAARGVLSRDTLATPSRFCRYAFRQSPFGRPLHETDGGLSFHETAAFVAVLFEGVTERQVPAQPRRPEAAAPGASKKVCVGRPATGTRHLRCLEAAVGGRISPAWNFCSASTNSSRCSLETVSFRTFRTLDCVPDSSDTQNVIP